MYSPAICMLRKLETFKHVLNFHRTMGNRKVVKFVVEGQRYYDQRAQRFVKFSDPQQCPTNDVKRRMTLWSCHLRLLRPFLELFAHSSFNLLVKWTRKVSVHDRDECGKKSALRYKDSRLPLEKSKPMLFTMGIAWHRKRIPKHLVQNITISLLKYSFSFYILKDF